MTRRRKTPLIILSGILLLALVTCCPMGQRVTLRKESGEIVYSARVPSGEKVWILYTHSVNKGLVEDGYEPKDGKLYLRCSRIRQWGAGIPEPEPGQTFEVKDGYYELSGFDIVLDTQWTFVGRVADHRLRIGEDGPMVHYNDLCEPGKRLGLSTDDWTLVKSIIWRCRRT